MPAEKGPKPPLSGIIYGECAYWIALLGMAVGIVGIVMSFFGGSQFFNPEALISGLWAGKEAPTIWNEAAGKELIHGHWYLSRLSYGDAVAMLGIGICCLSAVFGVWGAFFAMLAKKERPPIFTIFALILAIILILASAGVISIH